jgi:hypothetical protein
MTISNTKLQEILRAYRANEITKDEAVKRLFAAAD